MPKQKHFISAGHRFSMLTIIKEMPQKMLPSGRLSARIFQCKCDCGEIKNIEISTLLRPEKNGKKPQRDCGCIQKIQFKNLVTTHGLTNHTLFSVWTGMKTRCYNKNGKAYKNYGGRGIYICKSWLKDFLYFYNWAIKNGWEKGLEIDRRNNNRGYMPSNCRFVDRLVNGNNRRTCVYYKYKGDRLTVPQISRKLGLKKSALYSRLYRGIPLQQAINMSYA